MALTTLDDVKTYLGIDVANTEYDTLLETFRAAVEQTIINYCNTTFEEVVETDEVHDGDLSDTIVPIHSPVISVEGVYIDGGVVDTDWYYYDEGVIIFKNRYSSPFSRGIVTIDYTHGYTTVPADVKLCVYQAVKAEFQRHDRKTEDVTSRSKEGESESYGGAWDEASGLPRIVVNRLRAYKDIDLPVTGYAQRNR